MMGTQLGKEGSEVRRGGCREKPDQLSKGPSKAKNSCVNLEIKLSYLPIKNGFIQEYQRMATWDKQAVAIIEEVGEMGEELHWCKLGVQRAVAFHRLSCDSLPLAVLWERGGENSFSLLPGERRSNSILSP